MKQRHLAHRGHLRNQEFNTMSFQQLKLALAVGRLPTSWSDIIFGKIWKHSASPSKRLSPLLRIECFVEVLEHPPQCIYGDVEAKSRQPLHLACVCEDSWCARSDRNVKSNTIIIIVLVSPRSTWRQRAWPLWSPLKMKMEYHHGKNSHGELDSSEESVSTQSHWVLHQVT